VAIFILPTKKMQIFSTKSKKCKNEFDVVFYLKLHSTFYKYNENFFLLISKITKEKKETQILGKKSLLQKKRAIYITASLLKITREMKLGVNISHCSGQKKLLRSRDD